MTRVNTFLTIKKKFEQLEQSRQELQRISTDAQRRAKQAIFSLQRGDTAQATRLLDESESLLTQIQKTVRQEPRLAHEGMWRAALEEYAEARICQQIVRKEALFKHQISDDPDILIGALSDAIGETARMCVASATRGDRKDVERLHLLALEVVEFLTSLNLTGSLRSKGDQARQHLRKIEDILYDVSRLYDRKT